MLYSERFVQKILGRNLRAVSAISYSFSLREQMEADGMWPDWCAYSRLNSAGYPLAMRQTLKLLAELAPLGEPMVMALSVYGLELTVISRHSRRQLAAAGVGVEHLEIILGRGFSIVLANQFFHYLNAARVSIFNIAVVQVKSGYAVHG